MRRSCWDVRLSSPERPPSRICSFLLSCSTSRPRAPCLRGPVVGRKTHESLNWRHELQGHSPTHRTFRARQFSHARTVLLLLLLIQSLGNVDQLGCTVTSSSKGGEHFQNLRGER